MGRLFTARDRAKILGQKAGRPTGVIFEFGEMEFDLVAPTSRETMELLDVVQDLSGSASDQGMIVRRLRQMLGVARDLLRRSAEREAGSEFDAETFSAWFDEQAPLELINALAPKLVAAAGVSSVVADPPKPAAAPAVKAEPEATPTPPMQSVSS